MIWLNDFWQTFGSRLAIDIVAECSRRKIFRSCGNALVVGDELSSCAN
jgi:hypothetical protein